MIVDQQEKIVDQQEVIVDQQEVIQDQQQIIAELKEQLSGVINNNSSKIINYHLIRPWVLRHSVAGGQSYNTFTLDLITCPKIFLG